MSNSFSGFKLAFRARRDGLTLHHVAGVAVELDHLQVEENISSVLFLTRNRCLIGSLWSNMKVISNNQMIERDYKEVIFLCILIEPTLNIFN